MFYYPFLFILFPTTPLLFIFFSYVRMIFCPHFVLLPRHQPIPFQVSHTKCCYAMYVLHFIKFSTHLY